MEIGAMSTDPILWLRGLWSETDHVLDLSILSFETEASDSPKMTIGNLPLEIFRKILKYHVEDVGVYRAIESRLVSRVFSSEIEVAIFTLDYSYLSKHRHLIKMRLEMKKRWLQTRLGFLSTHTCKLYLLIDLVLKRLDEQFGKNDGGGRTEALVEACADSLNIFNLISISAPLSKTEERSFISQLMNESTTFDTHFLVAAATIGNKRAVIALLAKGTDPKNLSSFFGRVSNAAARFGHLHILQILIVPGYDFQNELQNKVPILRDSIYQKPTDYERSSFEIAAAFGQTAAAKLIEDLVRIPLASWHWQIAASEAIRFGHLPIVDWFLTRYYTSEFEDTERRLPSPLDLVKIACQFGRDDVVRHITCSDDFDFMHGERRHKGSRKTILQQHCIQTNWALQLLNDAGQGGNPRLVERLIHQAVQHKKLKSVLVDEERCKTFEKAALRNQIEATGLLLDGESKLFYDYYRKNLLLYLLIEAIQHRHFAMARLLIEAGADARHDEIPFMDLCQEGREDEVRFLLEAGYDPDKTHWLGERERRLFRPLSRALVTGHFRVARILLKFGATPISPPLGTLKDDRSLVKFDDIDPQTWCSCKMEPWKSPRPSHRQMPSPESWPEFGMPVPNLSTR